MSADAATPPKKSSKALIVGVLVVLLLGGGGAGGAWWFMGRQADGDEEQAQARKPSAKPVFTVLEPFTVNLQDDRGERFAQIGVTLEVDDGTVDALIKERLPAVRNNILLLVSSKRMEDLLTPEGKQALAEQVRVKAGEGLGWKPADEAAASDEDDEDEAPKKKGRKKKARAAEPNPIRRVLFSQFIVQ